MTRKYSSTSIETTLAATLASGAGTTLMTVANNTATALLGGVTLAAGNVDQFTVAIDPDTASEEIVFITAVNGNDFTIVRARAGTTAIQHNTGAVVRHVLSSDDLNFYTAGVATADAAIPETTVTTKGDLLAATTNATVTRVPVGNNGYILTADSAQSTGMKWTTNIGIPVTLVTAKGDLIAGTASGSVTNLAVGANSMVLVADSTQAAGVRWDYVSATIDPTPTVFLLMGA